MLFSLRLVCQINERKERNSTFINPSVQCRSTERQTLQHFTPARLKSEFVDGIANAPAQLSLPTLKGGYSRLEGFYWINSQEWVKTEYETNKNEYLHVFIKEYLCTCQTLLKLGKSSIRGRVILRWGPRPTPFRPRSCITYQYGIKYNLKFLAINLYTFFFFIFFLNKKTRRTFLRNANTKIWHV